MSVRMQVDRDPVTDAVVFTVSIPFEAQCEMRSFTEAEIRDRISSAFANVAVQVCAMTP